MPFQHSSDSFRQKNFNKEEKALRCEQPSPPTEPPEISNIWTLIPSIFVRSFIHPLLCKVSYMRMKYPISKIRSSQENQPKETNDWCCCWWWWWWCSCCRRTIHLVLLCTFFHQFDIFTTCFMKHSSSPFSRSVLDILGNLRSWEN